jgi:chemotaxis protein MotB
VVGATLGVGCGIPKEKYQAAVSEADRNMKGEADQRQRAEAAEAKLRETQARLDETEGQLRDAQAQASAGEGRATELSARLADVEQKASAASGEAERQRQEAESLRQERSNLQAKSSEYESLASSLDKEIKAGRIQLSELQGKLTVRMGEKVLFPSGSATISPDGKATLQKIAEAFGGVKGRMIRVEGHTDNVPIHNARFPSNWELASGRAIAVVRFLQDQGVDPSLLGAAGYGEHQPIADNGTPDGRAQNRRIEISLAAPLQEVPTAPAP